MSGIYESGIGDRLVDPNNFPDSLRECLVGESVLLDRAMVGRELLVEVGCMSARHAQWAVERGLRYMGIDPSIRYFEEARRSIARMGMSADRCSVHRATAEQLHMLPEIDLGRRQESLLFFPFNCFGNIGDPRSAIAAVGETGIDFVVSSYGTDERATEVRRRYYEMSEIGELSVERNDMGVRFAGTLGLRSIAYYPNRLVELFREASINVVAVSDPASIGAFYVPCAIRHSVPAGWPIIAGDASA